MVLTRAGKGSERKRHAPVTAYSLAPLPLSQLLARVVPFIVAEVFIGVLARVERWPFSEIFSDDARVFLDSRRSLVSALLVELESFGYFMESSSKRENASQRRSVFDGLCSSLALVCMIFS